MVNAVTYYEDASGKPHKAIFDAHRADLAILFNRSEDVSETSAKKLAERFAGNADECDELIASLQSIRDNRPFVNAVAPAARYEDEAA